MRPPSGALSHEWIDAGYFIISGGSSPERRSGLLPPRIVTVSSCVVECWPDIWALPWAKTDPEQLRGIRETLALDDSELADLLSWVEQALEDGRFGWPNVFFSQQSAHEFRSRFLAAVHECRIVGLCFARNIADAFVQAGVSRQANAPGVWTALRRGVPVAHDTISLGFDVLGAEYGGSFHTFSCNGLEKDFSEKLGIRVNSYGLIDDYSKAVAACAYTNRDDVGAEPVAWYPVRVDGYECVQVDDCSA